MNRNTVIGTLAAALAVVLAGCSNTAPPAGPGTATTTATTSAATSAHNDADVAFVQAMIPHHTQAVQMSQLAQRRATNPQVKQLATQIAQAQGPEIQQMQAMLQSRGAPAQPTASAGMPGSNMPDMPGMMADAQMRQLQQASGAAFDRMWLQMMIQHHTAAIQMSQTELRNGNNPDAKALAQKIIDAQQAEITQMQAVLRTI